jgi:hypothetical protein
MLFYGKEIDFTTIIIIVVLILAAYILFSYYQQQKQTIPIIVTSNSATTSTSIAIPNNIKLDNGAFALSIWIKLNSAIPSTLTTFNILNVNKKSESPSPSPSPPFLSLTFDNSGNLVVSSPIDSSTRKTPVIPFPVGEPVNIVLNYNGDDDIDPDKDETVYDPTTNTNISVYNPDSNTFYKGSKRALDVYINGLLNNTLSIDTLTNSKADANSPSPYITYTDASMNYITTNGNQVVIGDTTATSASLDGTISNATFIKNGCSPQDVRNIFNQGQNGSILENLLSYKLRFSFIEDDKEMKTYDFL